MKLCSNFARSAAARSLLPLALAVLPLSLAVNQALAQTANVTLYGVVDAGVQHVTGVRGGAVTQVVSGIMEGSRWGLRGTEDLGGGYKATFVLENRFEADTGSLSNRTISGNQLPDRLPPVFRLRCRLRSTVPSARRSV